MFFDCFVTFYSLNIIYIRKNNRFSCFLKLLNVTKQWLFVTIKYGKIYGGILKYN